MNEYNREIEPEINILWKALSLANFEVATLLLDNGLASINYQMIESGETCLIKTLKAKVGSNMDSLINNEKDRKEIVRFLLEEGEEWWADVNITDASG